MVGEYLASSLGRSHGSHFTAGISIAGGSEIGGGSGRTGGWSIGVFLVVVVYAMRTAVTDRLLQTGLQVILGGEICSADLSDSTSIVPAAKFS